MELTKADRKQLQSHWNRKFTNRQWEILCDQVSNADEDEDVNEIIIDVITNLDSYEQEYRDWDNGIILKNLG
jgi:hypothetical protein